MIPWYLILGGCLTIVLLVVRVLLARVGDHMSHYYSTVLFLVLWIQVAFSTIYDILALVMTTMWLIAGTKFVLSLHQRKNYATHNPNQDVRT